ncbi:MAG TPA: hypothetical protein PK668_09840 [Myxococcota bacterium]|nr:hypothetical protein [Myxococcota bacterium]HRY93534.1 hypothetical protein [Myxococcota bacterium]HSA20555.1 hypothetical protein [Myxococcota bacterium]
MRTAITLTTLALLSTLAGCEGEEIAGNCKRDSDCMAGYRCSLDHQCLCTIDQACLEGEYCNADGFCQRYTGCRTDPDCGLPAGAWRCQITAAGSGQCLCLTNEACTGEQVCNTSGSCQDKAGCVLDGDCGDPSLFQCRINPETSIGECFCKVDGACQDNEFCNFYGYCQPRTTCATNEDCPAGRFCNVADGECLCNSEAQTGCRSDEVCNASGFCQPRPGCYDNADCVDIAGTFCDYTTRTCVPEGTCSASTQCPLGQVCSQRVCTTGCNSSDDCELDQRCSNFQCVTGCQSDEFCDFIEFCTDGTCTSAYSAANPFCKACAGGGDILGCGTRGNSCLIYPYTGDPFANAGNEDYCAPDCSGGQRCPQGFECSTVITIKQSDLCQTNADCPSGLPCLKSAEEDQGFCPCAANNTCPSNTCLTGDTCGMSGKCFALSMSGIDLPCSTAADCNICTVTMDHCMTNADCQAISCELYDGVNYGGCVSAKACGLVEGMHCDP